MSCFALRAHIDPEGRAGQAEHPYLSWRTRLLFFIGCIIIAVTACTSTREQPLTDNQARVDLELLLTLPTENISYQSQVRPILGRRCVVCHGCYDAPCQLKLSSPQGIERGANKKKVYDGSRILAADPTRLFIDAKSTAEWRTKNFHTVLNEDTSDPRQNLENSVLYRMLRLKQRHPQPRVGMLPDSLELGLNREQTCATLAEFDGFAREHPDWGMPYGMPNLEDDEYRGLVQWLAQGVPVEPSEAADDQTRERIERWETFLNGASNKQQLVSRYLYEHLFHAHLHFRDTGEREFYRLVRWQKSDAALTVFRHLDSASVSFGLVGDYPETAWVIDYPLFERIHYLLVAGFDVYRNLGHQLNTRLFMDFLRMEGENYFLAFLPAASRKPIRDSWYKGIRARLLEQFEQPMDWLDVASVSGYKTDDPQRELYQLLEQRFRSISQLEHDLDRCQSEACIETDNSDLCKRADRAMQKIANVSGRNLIVFPDVAFVRVRTGDDPLTDMAYTLIRNNAYTHVTSMFEDASAEANRDFELDSLTVVDWLEGSYPNFFFMIDINDIEEFAKHYRTIRTRDDYEQFVARYGIRRTNENFWRHADWFHDQYAREKPVLSGLFDLNRYRNR